MAGLSMRDLEKIALATLTGMTTDEFEVEGKNWLAAAKDPRWNRPYTELVYQPMLEVMTYLRANAFKTDIVTGFGQDFAIAVVVAMRGEWPFMQPSPKNWPGPKMPTTASLPSSDMTTTLT
jgi:hypothetical protein